MDRADGLKNVGHALGIAHIRCDANHWFGLDFNLEFIMLDANVQDDSSMTGNQPPTSTISTDADRVTIHGQALCTCKMFSSWVATWLSGAFRSGNIIADLPEIRGDVLVLPGLADRCGTWRQAATIAEGVGPRTRQVLSPGCGHTPHREAPRRTLAAIRQFIASGLRPPGHPPEEVDGSC
jgi:pimeloyl-ACP methyl ester carboxylesterase